MKMEECVDGYEKHLYIYSYLCDRCGTKYQKSAVHYFDIKFPYEIVALCSRISGKKYPFYLITSNEEETTCRNCISEYNILRRKLVFYVNDRRRSHLIQMGMHIEEAYEERKKEGLSR